MNLRSNEISKRLKEIETSFVEQRTKEAEEYLNDLKYQLVTKKDLLTKTKEDINELSKMKSIVISLMERIISKPRDTIEKIVRLALNTVWDNPLELKIDFNFRRGQLEADVLLLDNGEEIKPRTSSGGGEKDIISFASKIAMWSLGKRDAKVMIIDEPFKGVSPDLQDRIADILMKISEKLGIQIIMISHAEIDYVSRGIHEIFVDRGVAGSYVSQTS